MPRGARILIENAYYHIINRGNKKEHIFLNFDDFKKFLEILIFYKKRFKVKVLGYCLMPNHVHMVLDIANPKNLAKFMQSLTQAYAMWFNKKYNKVGHLWQDRYKSFVIQKNRYFLECIFYVEVNPVRGNLVTSPADYIWSSYQERVLGIKKGILDIPDST